MTLQELNGFALEKLREALGAKRVARVAVDVGRESDGAEFLDITVYANDLPSASDSIAATRSLRHSLTGRGEERFPNVVYVSTADAA